MVSQLSNGSTPRLKYRTSCFGNLWTLIKTNGCGVSFRRKYYQWMRLTVHFHNEDSTFLLWSGSAFRVANTHIQQMIGAKNTVQRRTLPVLRSSSSQRCCSGQSASFTSSNSNASNESTNTLRTFHRMVMLLLYWHLIDSIIRGKNLCTTKDKQTLPEVKSWSSSSNQTTLSSFMCWFIAASIQH